MQSGGLISLLVAPLQAMILVSGAWNSSLRRVCCEAALRPYVSPRPDGVRPVPPTVVEVFPKHAAELVGSPITKCQKAVCQCSWHKAVDQSSSEKPGPLPGDSAWTCEAEPDVVICII